MALSPAKRYFSSNPWDFPVRVVIAVRSGNATNPLTQKPAEDQVKATRILPGGTRQTTQRGE